MRFTVEHVVYCAFFLCNVIDFSDEFTTDLITNNWEEIKKGSKKNVRTIKTNLFKITGCHLDFI